MTISEKIALPVWHGEARSNPRGVFAGFSCFSE
jgi:hypothetical protein